MKNEILKAFKDIIIEEVEDCRSMDAGKPEADLTGYDHTIDAVEEASDFLTVMDAVTADNFNDHEGLFRNLVDAIEAVA